MDRRRCAEISFGLQIISCKLTPQFVRVWGQFLYLDLYFDAKCRSNFPSFRKLNVDNTPPSFAQLEFLPLDF